MAQFTEKQILEMERSSQYIEDSIELCHKLLGIYQRDTNCGSSEIVKAIIKNLKSAADSDAVIASEANQRCQSIEGGKARVDKPH